jgi:hypothetical protein
MRFFTVLTLLVASSAYATNEDATAWLQTLNQVGPRLTLGTAGFPSALAREIEQAGQDACLALPVDTSYARTIPVMIGADIQSPGRALRRWVMSREEIQSLQDCRIFGWYLMSRTFRCTPSPRTHTRYCESDLVRIRFWDATRGVWAREELRGL